MTLRDSLLPVAALGSQLADTFGLNRYSVVVRTRTWKGDVGDETAGYTDVTTTISPRPSVEEMSPYSAQMSGLMGPEGSYLDRFYKITSLTPQYVDPADGLTKGNTPQELAPYAADDHTEVTYVLTGDDGVSFECVFAAQDFTDPFEYQLIVRQRRRPHSSANAP